MTEGVAWGVEQTAAHVGAALRGQASPEVAFGCDLRSGTADRTVHRPTAAPDAVVDSDILSVRTGHRRVPDLTGVVARSATGGATACATFSFLTPPPAWP